MKYLEQRVDELELEVKLLKAKNKLKEITIKEKDTTHYLNNYSPTPDWRNKEINDYMFNPSINLLSEPDLETTFASPWDTSEMYKNPLDTITKNSIEDDTFSNNDSHGHYPPYPNIVGSWDDFDFTRLSKDWASFNQTDEIPPYPGHKNIVSEYLCPLERKIEKEFGKIISKFKILHHEWEMDGYGYIVKDLEYNKNIIVTNHGKPMIVNKDYLNEIISSYKETIQETERALFLLK
jgi:hypothetical protein